MSCRAGSLGMRGSAGSAEAALKGAGSLAERRQLLASMAALKEHLALAAAPPPAGTAPPPPEVWEVFVAILDEVAAGENVTPQILPARRDAARRARPHR